MSNKNYKVRIYSEVYSKKSGMRKVGNTIPDVFISHELAVKYITDNIKGKLKFDDDKKMTGTVYYWSPYTGVAQHKTFKIMGTKEIPKL